MNKTFTITQELIDASDPCSDRRCILHRAFEPVVTDGLSFKIDWKAADAHSALWTVRIYAPGTTLYDVYILPDDLAKVASDFDAMGTLDGKFAAKYLGKSFAYPEFLKLYAK